MSSARRAFVLLATLAATIVAFATTASAETITLPSGAATGSSSMATLLATSCPATGDCVAVGSYVDSSGHKQGLIDTETNGSWTTSAANLTGLTPYASPNVYLASVSCTTVGNCVAVGTYNDASNYIEGLIETETNGVWTSGRAGLPSNNSTSNPYVTLNSVSCPSAGNCVAIGGYGDLSNYTQGLIETESGGVWTPSEISLASLPSVFASPSVDMDSISCAAAGNCVAVGTYDDLSVHRQGLIETESSGAWTTSEASLSGLSTYPNPDVALNSVVCVAAGTCTAVGDFRGGGGGNTGLLLTEQTGVWKPAVGAALPANAAASTGSQDDLTLSSVSCASAGNCVAVGDYSATSSNADEGLFLTETAGSWATGTETNLPTAGAANPYTELGSVTCLANGSCYAVGAYADSAGAIQALVAQRTAGGTWSTANSQVTSAAYVYSESAVSCSPSGYCAAAGDANGATPFLLDAPAAVAAPSVAATGTQAMVSWAPPSDSGGLAISGYTATATDLTNPARGGQTAVLAGGTTTVVITGLTPGDSYSFTIVPANLLGIGISANSGTITVPAPPVSPVAGPTKAAIRASLSALLAPRGAATRVKKLRRAHSYTFRYDPLESGRVVIRWYEITGRRKHRRRHLVAAGSARTSGTDTTKIKVRFTARGKRLIKTHARLKLTAVVRFTSGRTKVTRTHTFVLR